MAFIMIVLFAVVIGLVGLFFIRASKPAESRRGRDDNDRRILGIVLSIFSLVLLVIGSFVVSFRPIEAGHIGIVYQFGGIVGQIGEGANFIAPWRSVRVANIQVQSHTFEKLDSFSQETQDVFVRAVLNIRVSPQAVQELYRTVGPNYFQVLVAPRVAQNFKDETVKYKSVDIAPNREEIRATVGQRLERELSPHSIEVVSLLLENIDFRSEFKNAIEKKQIATQNALEEEQRILVAQRQAEQSVKTAEGQAKSITVVANGQAEANRLLSESLTEPLIRYTLIQKIGPDIKVMILPAGQEFILGSDFLKP